MVKLTEYGTRDVLQKTGIDARTIRAIAVSGHSLGCVPIGTKGELLQEYVPIWSDSRGTKHADKFFTSVNEEEWYNTTGNGFPAGLYTAFKIKWYEENRPAVFSKIAKAKLAKKDKKGAMAHLKRSINFFSFFFSQIFSFSYFSIID